jgi:heme exporter protein C
MLRVRSILRFYSLVTLLVCVLAVVNVVVVTPAGGDDVLLKKILFVHLPAATTTFLACAAVFVASVGQVALHRRAATWWDRLAEAAGIVAAAACTVLLATGMIWAKQAWGEWWAWSPRLTFSLVLWVLYPGFLVVRPLVREERRAHVSAVYGIVAFLDVPLVYMSVKILPDVHPASVAMDGSMKRTLLMCVVGAAMVAGGFVASRLSARGKTLRTEPPLGAVPTVLH